MLDKLLIIDHLDARDHFNDLPVYVAGVLDEDEIDKGEEELVASPAEIGLVQIFVGDLLVDGGEELHFNEVFTQLLEVILDLTKRQHLKYTHSLFYCIWRI